MEKIKVSEIFYSVQGEIDIGKPVIFVRFSGCNLIKSNKACKWCDSLFAQTELKEMTVEEILKEVKKYKCKNVVISGGEPLTQIKGLKSLFWKLSDLNYNICMETNGTIYNDIIQYFNKISCSPKKQSINLTTLKQINTLSNVRFKFVFDNDKNKWWEKVIRDVKISQNKVWIMAEGRTKIEQEKKMEKVIDYCKEKGYNFTPRLQVLIWGKRRKV